jgi:hypothetical protein
MAKGQLGTSNPSNSVEFYSGVGSIRLAITPLVVVQKVSQRSRNDGHPATMLYHDTHTTNPWTPF